MYSFTVLVSWSTKSRHWPGHASSEGLKEEAFLASSWLLVVAHSRWCHWLVDASLQPLLPSSHSLFPLYLSVSSLFIRIPVMGLGPTLLLLILPNDTCQVSISKYSFPSPSVDWIMHTHTAEVYLLYSVHQFKRWSLLKTSSQTHLKIMFNQIAGYPMTWKS